MKYLQMFERVSHIQEGGTYYKLDKKFFDKEFGYYRKRGFSDPTNKELFDKEFFDIVKVLFTYYSGLDVQILNTQIGKIEYISLNSSSKSGNHSPYQILDRLATPEEIQQYKKYYSFFNNINKYNL